MRDVMAFRLFEERDHVAAYLQYRLTPYELINKIMDFMEPKMQNKFNLAVDVGCGNGKGTVLLAPFFKQVVGTDVSPAQLELARAYSTSPNVSYSQSPAEELPFESGQVDLLAAMTAAHWFEWPRFLKEAERVLKPNGCLALLSNTMDMELEYGDATSALNDICKEFYAALLPYKNPCLGTCSSQTYLEMFDSCPFPDKEWNGCQKIYRTATVNRYIGLVETFTSYRKMKSQDATAAKRLSDDIRNKLMAAMQVSSPDVELTIVTKYFYILARKP
ncbi:putative methyltransferase DDB_G0268948 [Syngnathus scovelli]|uniref:putative methyltransferase DDB_G0268948 n=1 Tax=Syngnathus scovelli TaxID=161590 RepID=UPI00210FEC7F|nr:putative methyltransferase DDB_G0268948 [Syngnathus scovelli]